MRVRVQAQPVVGQEGEGYWSQLLVLPEGARLEADSINPEDVICALAFTISGDAADALGRELIRLLHLQEQDVDQRFELSYFEHLTDDHPEIESMAVVVFSGHSIRVLGYGGGMAVLKRKEQLGTVMVAPDNQWIEKSGHLVPGDRLLFGTSGLVGEMSRDLTQEVLSLQNADLAGEELVTRVQAAEESARAAGYVVYVHEGVNEVLDETLLGGGEVQVVEISEENEKEVEVRESPRPEVFLRKPPRKKTTFIMVGSMLLVILSASIRLGLQHKETVEWEARYKQSESQIQPVIDEAKSLASTNRGRSMQLLSEATMLVDTALTEFQHREAFREKLEGFKEEIGRIQAEASGEKSIGHVPLWVDLTVVKEGVFGERLAIDRNTVVVLDGRSSVLFTIDGSTKEMKLVGGGALLTGSKLLSSVGGRAIVLSSSGIVEWSITNKTSALIAPIDPEWGDVVELSLFGGSIYLMDVEKDTVWRYPGLEAGVGAKRRWFTSNLQVDLAGAVDMAIDGDIWIAYGSGKVERYRRGDHLGFTIKDLPDPLGNVVQLYTHESLEAIYLLDRAKTRIVAVSKEGSFIRQYVWQGLAGAQDFAVLRNEGVLVILSGSSLYRIPLE